DSAVWEEVLELGATLDRLDEVAGTRVQADVALLFSWEAWWAADSEARFSGDVRYLDQVHAAYRALYDEGVSVDVVRPGGDLTGYRLVVVPSLHLTRDAEAAAVERFVADGGHALVTFNSGIVDESDTVRLGGYPGAFRDLLGVRSDEIFPLLPGQHVTLSDGATARTWTEHVRATTAQVHATFADGPVAGSPAVTRNAHGSGTAWYVATALDDDDLRALVRDVVGHAGAGAPGAGL